MTLIVYRNNRNGFSLIEVMIALVVTLIVFLALMQTVLLSISSNTKNVLRNEAVSLSEETLNAARTVVFDSLTSDSTVVAGCPAQFTAQVGTAGVLVPRTIRNKTVNFCTNTTVNNVDADTKQITVTVGWSWGDEYSKLESMTIRRR